MRRYLQALALASLFLALAFALAAGMLALRPAKASPPACDAYCQEVYSQPPWPGLKITEDDPAWNCHTMGNHICGKGRG